MGVYGARRGPSRASIRHDASTRCSIHMRDRVPSPRPCGLRYDLVGYGTVGCVDTRQRPATDANRTEIAVARAARAPLLTALGLARGPRSNGDLHPRARVLQCRCCSSGFIACAASRVLKLALHFQHLSEMLPALSHQRCGTVSLPFCPHKFGTPKTRAKRSKVQKSGAAVVSC